ncbi:Ribosomal large subunit pseudouridine synthase A [Planctopirus ephydatiae]|uniref:tRNA uridine(34) hydroxylase n=2 Tax=Planctopirus ephydatiae TaxID=2528019 RepID=A0A518GT71_9PLAN|nr:Ribosomal large subunit pseudouridine synthase A [Planctopirus ephydatiae]
MLNSMCGCEVSQGRQFPFELLVGMSVYTNISTYRFAPLADLKPLREKLLSFCHARELKGTILLSTEGINMFIAGFPEKVEELLEEVRKIPGLEGLPAKYSPSDHQPFTRMLVRIKREIIAFGLPEIDPSRQPAPKLSPKELKAWLDEGRPVTLLDTRNDYEVKLGTFENAIDLNLATFRDFPEVSRQKLPPELKKQPVVMFCTGGIRCEKAGPFFVKEGYEQVYQLDGGILKYFEECGSAHYQGECFVFDQRVGVDPNLEESSTTQCLRCQTPLVPEEQADPRYVIGQSCPYCFKTSAQEMEDGLRERERMLQGLIDPLPGCVSYVNDRPLQVSQKHAGLTVREFLQQVLPHLEAGVWESAELEGRLLSETFAPMRLDETVHPGQRIIHRLPGTIEPAVNADIRWLYEDESIVVINKPAPLPVHASGRFHRNTLQYLLAQIYDPQSPRAAHRLDAMTTGVLVLSRTRHMAGRLQPQFSRREVEKVYLARVQGEPAEESFECHAPMTDVAGVMGSREIDESGGVEASTLFRLVQRLGDGTSLLEVRPITGRTNQIRVHLWHLGLPILGDPLYMPGGELATEPKDSEQVMCLHAWRIRFQHPVDRTTMEFTAPPPAWAGEAGAVS